MASGQDDGEKNLATFVAWLARQSDDDFRQMVHRGALNKVEIAKQCRFGRSALDQNARIKTALKDKETELRERGVLPALVETGTVSRDQDLPPRQPSANKAAFEMERIRRLEEENASLRAENRDLKQRLDKYVALSVALGSTGRLPR